MILNSRYVLFQCLDYILFYFVYRKKKGYLPEFLLLYRHTLKVYVLGNLMRLGFAVQTDINITFINSIRKPQNNVQHDRVWFRWDLPPLCTQLLYQSIMFNILIFTKYIFLPLYGKYTLGWLQWLYLLVS